MAVRTTNLALCAGIGGLEKGLSQALRGGCRTVAYVEREAFPVAHLAHEMETGRLAPAPIWDDVATFDGRPWRGRVHTITAGYPCQPFSSAGKRLRTADGRWLWDDIKRIIGEVRPLTCFFENTPQHAVHGLSQVVSDLEGMGYSVACGLFRASDVGLPHKRERLFILAHAYGVPVWQLSRRGDGTDGPVEAEPGFDRGRVADSGRGRCEVLRGGELLDRERETRGDDPDGCRPRVPERDTRPEEWPQDIPEPGVRGGSDGLAYRTHRLRALGNAVIPDVAELAFRVLSDALAEQVNPGQAIFTI